MNHHSLRRPRAEGVRRASARPLPKLSDEAAQLVAGLPHDSAIFGPAVAKLMREIAAQPSRPGAEVLAHFAATMRNAGNLDAAKDMTAASDAITASCDATEARQSAVARALEVADTAIKEAYERGFAAGQDQLRKELPAVLRETTFVMDSKDRIVGKTEREFKPGGNR